MSIDNFIPTIWSALLFQRLDLIQVYASVVNRDYEGEISGAGDTVKINEVGEVDIFDYSKYTDFTIQVLDGAQKLLTIDQQKAFAFEIDDVDRVQQRPKVMGEAMRKAAEALATAVDTFIGGFHADAGSTIGTDGSPIALNSVNLFDQFSEAARLLDEKNVPTGGRFAVLTPWAHQKLVLARQATDQANTEVLTNGRVGRAHGFDVRMSNNVPFGVGGSATTKSKLTFGTTRAISFAQQIASLEAFRPETKFTDAMKGLWVYGGKMVDPDALVTLTADQTAEP